MAWGIAACDCKVLTTARHNHEGSLNVTEKTELELISRRRAFSIFGFAALSMAMAPTVLTVSDADAQQPTTTTGQNPQTGTGTTPQTDTERRQERRGERTERREGRREKRTERRQGRRTARTERRQERRNARTERRHERREARHERRTERTTGRANRRQQRNGTKPTTPNNPQ